MTAHEIYQQAIDVLPRMESFASSLQPAGIVFLQVPTDAVCGQTPSRIAPGVVQFILIGRGCLTPWTIYHEMTHAFLGPDYPDWYAEGMAELLAGHLMGALDSMAQYYAWGWLNNMPSVELNTRYEALTPPSQYAAGFTFLKEVHDIIGPDRLGEAVRSQRPSATGTAILDAIRGVTPPEQRAALEELIEKRVDLTK